MKQLFCDEAWDAVFDGLEDEMMQDDSPPLTPEQIAAQRSLWEWSAAIHVGSAGAPAWLQDIIAARLAEGSLVEVEPGIYQRPRNA